MPNLIPEKVLNFRVYSDNGVMLGIADGDFPSFEYMTSEVRGAGIAGTLESPGTGHFASTSLTLNWRFTSKDFWSLAAPGGHQLDLYAEGQVIDSGTGELQSASLHMFIKAFTKTFNAGKMTVVDSQEASTEHEVYYAKIEIDGQEVLEMDKLNYIFKVNGEDRLAKSRRALGMM